MIALVQTFVLIPLLIYCWGKGAYCGWICSCGALAETMGDTQRHKMPHGPRWNRAQHGGPGRPRGRGGAARAAHRRLDAAGRHRARRPRLRRASSMDALQVAGRHLPRRRRRLRPLLLVRGRVWCRFVCPLAALMHIYARFSRFRILADKKKCISCNVCTSVCHQGIDVMSFANKGLPMEDPECVRCSACVQSCPTGVLTFGQVDRAGRVVATDRLAASPVQPAEG